ncbi:MAG: MoaD family protein [Candidatus Cloacimonetes bacterium]|nr:MoaD family protein [Candidatus Cloacimonadota bacterium]
MIRIKFYSLLRMFLKQSEIEIDADKISVFALLQKVSEKTKKDIISEVIDAEQLIQGTIILVNGRNIYHLEKMNTIVRNGDKLDIFPPGGGG